MVDMERMAQTIRTIRDDGCGMAHQVPTALRGFDGNAGARKLDAQAVSDLIGCGWLTIPDRF
jgi:hypothetical protein